MQLRAPCHGSLGFKSCNGTSLPPFLGTSTRGDVSQRYTPLRLPSRRAAVAVFAKIKYNVKIAQNKRKDQRAQLDHDKLYTDPEYEPPQLTHGPLMVANIPGRAAAAAAYTHTPFTCLQAHTHDGHENATSEPGCTQHVCMRSRGGHDTACPARLPGCTCMHACQHHSPCPCAWPWRHRSHLPGHTCHVTPARSHLAILPPMPLAACLQARAAALSRTPT